MGCHTWFYERVKLGFTYDELANQLIKFYTDKINTRDNDSYIDYILSLYDGIDYGDYYFHLMRNEGEKLRDFAIRVENYLIWTNMRICRWYHKKWIPAKYVIYYFEAYLENLGYDFNYNYNTDTFLRSVTYHDIFRIGNYPNDQLTTLDDTLEFIDKNIDKISFVGTYEQMIQRLTTFFIKYPRGVIKFG